MIPDASPSSTNEAVQRVCSKFCHEWFNTAQKLSVAASEPGRPARAAYSSLRKAFLLAQHTVNLQSPSKRPLLAQLILSQLVKHVHPVQFQNELREQHPSSLAALEQLLQQRAIKHDASFWKHHLEQGWPIPPPGEHPADNSSTSTSSSSSFASSQAENKLRQMLRQSYRRNNPLQGGPIMARAVAQMCGPSGRSPAQTLLNQLKMVLEAQHTCEDAAAIAEFIAMIDWENCFEHLVKEGDGQMMFDLGAAVLAAAARGCWASQDLLEEMVREPTSMTKWLGPGVLQQGLVKRPSSILSRYYTAILDPCWSSDPEWNHLLETIAQSGIQPEDSLILPQLIEPLRPLSDDLSYPHHLRASQLLQSLTTLHESVPLPSVPTWLYSCSASPPVLFYPDAPSSRVHLLHLHCDGVVPPRLLDVLLQHNPDLLLLQDVHQHPQDQPSDSSLRMLLRACTSRGFAVHLPRSSSGTSASLRHQHFPLLLYRASRFVLQKVGYSSAPLRFDPHDLEGSMTVRRPFAWTLRDCAQDETAMFLTLIAIHLHEGRGQVAQRYRMAEVREIDGFVRAHNISDAVVLGAFHFENEQEIAALHKSSVLRRAQSLFSSPAQSTSRAEDRPRHGGFLLNAHRWTLHRPANRLSSALAPASSYYPIEIQLRLVNSDASDNEPRKSSSPVRKPPRRSRSRSQRPHWR